MKKRKPLNTTGAVAGYVRVSDVKAKFPPDCTSYEQREKFVEDLRRLRMSELIADAARQNETITEWYDDMGVSARGEFLVQRVSFDRARRDAQAGRVRKIYARDLSRLFRDLVQQELWFAEMDGYGCAVSIQDLPFIADEATRILLRQNLGSLNQYMATKTGQMLRANHGERVRAGLWVGRGQSMWGLKYNKETHHFDFDPATADKIRFVLETLAACGGVAGQAARRLNEAVGAGHPRATPTQTGKQWTAQSVLQTARTRLYGQEVHYFKGQPDEYLRHRPDLIPQVVDPALWARVQFLLEARAPKNKENAAKARASRLDYTYSPFLRCGVCGGGLGTGRPKDYGGRSVTPAGELPRWIAWKCKEATTVSTPVEQRCLGFGSVQQARIENLLGAGLRRALELYGQEQFAAPSMPASRAAPSTGTGEEYKSSLEAAMARLDSRRRRFHLMFADGQIRDKAELDGYLQEVEAERERLELRMRQVAEMSPQEARAVLPALSEEQWRRLMAEVDALWSSPVMTLPVATPVSETSPRAEALNLPKYELMKALGVHGHIHSLPREKRRRQRRWRDADGNLVVDEAKAGIKSKRLRGRIVIALELAALGLTGERSLTLTESEEAFEAYSRWVYNSGSGMETRFPKKSEEIKSEEIKSEEIKPEDPPKRASDDDKRAPDVEQGAS